MDPHCLLCLCIYCILCSTSHSHIRDVVAYYIAGREWDRKVAEVSTLKSTISYKELMPVGLYPSSSNYLTNILRMMNSIISLIAFTIRFKFSFREGLLKSQQ